MRDVALQVEVGILFPGWPAHAAGVWLRQALAVAGQLPEPVRQVARNLLARRRCATGRGIEDHDRADVHVRAVVGLLELEKGGVQCCQVLAHGAELEGTPQLACIDG